MKEFWGNFGICCPHCIRNIISIKCVPDKSKHSFKIISMIPWKSIKVKEVFTLYITPILLERKIDYHFYADRECVFIKYRILIYDIYDIII